MANMTPKVKARRRAAVVERYGGACGLCGEPLNGDVTLDHIVAKAEGGSNAESNLQPAHQKCNHRRHHPPTGG